MSALMLSDENTLNDINPFVVGGPGAWRKPFGFAPAAPDKDRITCGAYGCFIKTESGDKWEPKTENKIICNWGITSQTNGSLDAPSCFPPKNPISCPMSRALEPTQEFIPDLYTLIPYKQPIPKSLQQQGDMVMVLPIIGVIIILLMIVKR
jgi:hypothetical protein